MIQKLEHLKISGEMLGQGHHTCPLYETDQTMTISCTTHMCYIASAIDPTQPKNG